MQRKPALVRAFVEMQRVLWAANGAVDRGFKRIVAHVASRAADDRYSMAHTASGALHFGIDADKLAAAANYRTSPLYTAAEQTALDLAMAASATPCARHRRDVWRPRRPLVGGADRGAGGGDRHGRFPGAL